MNREPTICSATRPGQTVLGTPNPNWTDIARFELQPRPQGITKLAGTPNTWRVRVGDNRILLDIDDGAKTVLILRIAHRRDVYR